VAQRELVHQVAVDGMAHHGGAGDNSEATPTTAFYPAQYCAEIAPANIGVR